MPRNGSGGYSPPAGQPVVSGTAISSTVFNALVADLGNELTKSICTDGQTPMTANLPMGANRITNLGAATVDSDAVRRDQVVGAYLPLSGGALLGSVSMANSNSYQMKDAGGVVRSFAGLAGDNFLNMYVAGGVALRWLDQAGGAILWTMDNAGVVTQANNLIFPQNIGIFFKDTGGTPRQFAKMQGADVNFTIGGGGSFNYYNQAGTVVVASLTNSGTFSAVTVTQTSDERKKKLWQRLPHDFVKQLAGIRKSGLFTWRKGGAGLGVGAQSLERILPEAVHTDDKGAKTVNYGAAAMVSCVELAREMVALKAEFAKLVNK